MLQWAFISAKPLSCCVCLYVCACMCVWVWNQTEKSAKEENSKEHKLSASCGKLRLSWGSCWASLWVCESGPCCGSNEDLYTHTFIYIYTIRGFAMRRIWANCKHVQIRIQIRIRLRIRLRIRMLNTTSAALHAWLSTLNSRPQGKRATTATTSINV